MRRRSDVCGQAASEYVALVALVAVALALAAGLTSGGVGGQVLAGLRRGLCRVAARSCPAPRPPAADLAPCPLGGATSGESLDGAFELAKLGGEATLSAVRRSDGRVTVTLAHGTSLGVEAGVGLRVALGGRLGGDATVGASASVVSGRSWTLPDAAAARAFVARHGEKATIGGRAVDLVRSGCSLLCDAIGWRPHAALPPADEWYVARGGALKLQASLGFSSLEGFGGALLGARQGSDGSSTWYLQLDAGAGAVATGAPAAAGAGGEGESEAVVSYSLDARRRPAQLVVETVARSGARGTVGGARGALRAAAGAGAGLVVERDATLDLRDRRSRAVAEAFLAALRVPLPPGRLARRAAGLRAQVARAGVVDRRVYAVSSSTFELGAKLATGMQLGGAFARTREGMRLLSAETRLPGLPFLPRDDCRPS